MRPFVPFLICAIALVSCGGGGGSETPTLAAPTQLTVTPGSGVNTVNISWVPSTSGVDGYIIELKIGSGAFQAQNGSQNPIPAQATGLEVTLDPAAPDLTDYVIRMKAVKGGASSPYSNEAVYHRPLNAPTNLTGTFDWTRMGVALSWNLNSTGATGSAIKRAECDTNGQIVGNWTDLVGINSRVTTFLDTTVTLGFRYKYQVANTSGALTSGAVFGGPFMAGLRPPSPQGNAYYDPAQGGVVLQWAVNDSQSDGIRLERQALDSSFTPVGNWVSLPVPPGVSSSFLDRTLTEATRYQYRVCNLRGSYASAASLFQGFPQGRVLAPTNLTATVKSDGVQLAWQNQSSVADTLSIFLYLGQGGHYWIATLPKTTSSYLQPLPSPGYYTYVVRATFNGDTYPLAAETQVETLVPGTQGAMALTSAPVTLPSADAASLRPSGTWAMATLSPTLEALSNNDPWPAYPADGCLTDRSRVFRTDAQGYPHLIYAVVDPQDRQKHILNHAWYDGSAWRKEEMYKGKIGAYDNAFVAELGATGIPQALVLDSDTSALFYLRKEPAGWVKETVPATDFTGAYVLCLDGLNNPHALLGTSEVARTAPGLWVNNKLPNLKTSKVSFFARNGRWIDDNNAVVAVRGFNEQDQEVNAVVEKVAGIWQPPKILSTDARIYPYISYIRMALSADRSRIAIVHNTKAGLRVYHRDQDGWQQALVGRNIPNDWVQAGIDGSNKLHVLTRVNTGTAYVQYTEP